MTLQVPFDDFLEAAQRHASTKEVYVSRHTRKTVVTACGKDRVIVAASRLSVEAAKRALEKAGATVYPGAWSFEGELADEFEAEAHAHIVAISYQSTPEKSGVWVDAFDSCPTDVQALQAMYDEFVSTGQVVDLTFDAFLKIAHANVVICSPAEIAGWVAQKRNV